MTFRNAPQGPWAIQANQHNAESVRQMLQSLVPIPGIVNAGDLAVSANGTPNMSVNVASGFCILPGTQSTPSQGSYNGYNDATVNLTIAASSPSNPRIDIVVASIQDAAYSGTQNQGVLQVITGTPAPSPSPPATPANSVLLAQVAVATNATSITSGNITDKRQGAAPLGAPWRYKASAYLAAAQSVASGAFAIVNLDTKAFDPNVNFTTGAGAKYTAPVAGFYSVYGSIAFTSYISIAAGIYKNGALAKQGVTANSASVATVGGILQLAAGDTVQLAAFQNSGSAQNTNTGQQNVCLDVHFLSPAV